MTERILSRHEEALERPAESSTDKPVDPNTRMCVSCNRWHGGGGNKERLCLEACVRSLRARVEELERALARHRGA